MSSSPQYEFTQEQNTLVGSLASKMRVVGAFSVALGVVGLLITILVIVAIYRDRLPAGWADKIKEYQQAAREKLPEDARAQMDAYTPDKLPANNHLWGIVIYAGVTGVFSGRACVVAEDGVRACVVAEDGGAEVLPYS